MKKNKELSRILPPSKKIPKSYKSAKTIEEVEKDISEAIKSISKYKQDLTGFSTPQVQKFPFFSLPDTRRELVNSALESLWQFNKKSLSTIGNALETQNKNTKSLNHLICILAIAEAQLYTELNSLAKVDKKQAENVNKLSADIKDTVTKTNSLSKIQVQMALLRKESLTNLGERFTQIDDDISQKANQIEVDNLSDSVRSQESEIAQINESLKAKADESKVNEINDLLTKKANQTEVDDLLESVKSHESIITQQNGILENKADKSDLSLYAKNNVVFSKEEVVKKINNLWIAYGITTSTLLAGLIASFLI